MKTTLLLAFAAMLAGAGMSAHGQTAPVRNIVLAHGAFVDGSSWDKVAWNQAFRSQSPDE